MKGLKFSNITFSAENELQLDFTIGKFCQAIALLTKVENLEFEDVQHIEKVSGFFNRWVGEDVQKMPMLASVKMLNINACHVEEEH